MKRIWTRLKRVPIGAFLLETAVYAGFISVYFPSVLRISGDWLKRLFDHHKSVYAVAALVLIIIQGLLLGWITTVLARLIRPKPKTI